MKTKHQEIKRKKNTREDVGAVTGRPVVEIIDKVKETVIRQSQYHQKTEPKAVITARY